MLQSRNNLIRLFVNKINKKRTKFKRAFVILQEIRIAFLVLNVQINHVSLNTNVVRERMIKTVKQVNIAYIHAELVMVKMSV